MYSDLSVSVFKFSAFCVVSWKYSLTLSTGSFIILQLMFRFTFLAVDADLCHLGPLLSLWDWGRLWLFPWTSKRATLPKMLLLPWGWSAYRVCLMDRIKVRPLCLNFGQFLRISSAPEQLICLAEAFVATALQFDLPFD